MNKDDVTLIDKFLREELSAEEELQFNERMLDDSFKAQLASMQELQVLVKDQGAVRMKQMLQKIESRADQTTANKFKFRGLLYILIVSATISLIYMFWPKQDNQINQRLYATHYVPYPNIDNPIVKGNASKEALSISQFYEMSRFEKALNQFNNNFSNTVADSFYVSLSCLEIGQSFMAEQILTKIIQSQSSYKQPSEFYLSLTYLNNDKLDLAKALLDSISNQSDHPFQKKALNLLKDVAQSNK